MKKILAATLACLLLSASLAFAGGTGKQQGDQDGTPDRLRDGTGIHCPEDY